jgi:hypothetical protein
VKIPSLGVSQHFANEINWVLDLVIGIWLPSLDDNSCTNQITCSRYVKLQVFVGFWGYQGRWVAQILLQVFKGLLCLLSPLELMLFLEELKEWLSPDAES